MDEINSCKVFEDEALRIINAAQSKGIMLRLLGALAFHYHCPNFSYLQESLGRKYTDIDFAAYVRDNAMIKDIFAELGYIGNTEVNTFFGDSRLIFDSPETHIHVDVFFEKLDFCHPIPWADRLEKDSPTLPLPELLLEKMQIVEINEKDIIDTMMLLLEHDVGVQDDREVICLERIGELCGNDWGLWRTVTMNLGKVLTLSSNYDLDKEKGMRIKEQVDSLLNYLSSCKKSVKWKLRSAIGDRVRWYKEVEEIG